MTSTQQPSRRIVFQGLGALGVAAALAGCGDSGDGDSTSGDTTGGPETSPTDGPTSESPGGNNNTGGKELATTDEIPVGGGMILTDERIVITQPTAGEFKAFTAVCTHQGCTVSAVNDNVISCPCHGSQYDAASGDNIGGPAPAPLAEIEIRVKGNKILEA